MKKLSLSPLDTMDALVRPNDFNDTAMSTPALKMMQDFKDISPTVIDANTSAINALDVMQHEHSSLKIVINDDENMIGIIHFDHLCDQAIIKRIANGETRHELKVSDLMVPRQHIKSIDYQQLQGASIGDVVNTLQRHGEPYCLVVDNSNHQIRGIFIAEEISKRLHMPLTVHRAPAVINAFSAN